MRIAHLASEVVPFSKTGGLADVAGALPPALAATLDVLMHRGVRVVLLDCPALYVRPALYSLPDGDFPDNPVRFAFFARAALAAPAKLGGVEIIHAHDWQAALPPRFP